METGVLVVILSFVLNAIVSFLAVHLNLAFQVALLSLYILDFLLTVAGGIWIARKVAREAPLHGLLVGLVVALLTFLLGLVFSQSFNGPQLVVLGEVVLNVAAGWLGGVLGSRRREES